MNRINVITFLWCCISLAQANSFDKPIPFGVIGTKAPADFYVTDIASDSAGNIYTVDNFHKTVSKYSADGKLLMSFTDANFKFPRYLSVDANGNIYVMDSLAAQVRIFTGSGDLLDIWGGFQGPGEIEIDKLGRAVIALRGNPGTSFQSDQVLVYDLLGNELFRFGGLGSGPGQFSTPVGVSGGFDGAIWVTDVGNRRIQKFDENGNFLLTVGKTGSGPGEFKGPRSTAVDSMGNVFVSDRRNERVQKFDKDGNFLTEWGHRGIGAGLFLEMEGLDVAPDDTVWVAGFHAHDIQHFDNQGNFLDRWVGHVSGPGEFAHAEGIGLSDNKLFINDFWNQNVQVFDAASGRFMYKFGERNQGDATVFNFPRALEIGTDGTLYISDDDNIRHIMPDGQFLARFPRPSGVRIGSHGLVTTEEGLLFQADTGNNRINVVNATDGTILRQWGSKGSAPGQFNTPRGIALGRDGSLFVADSNNKRIQRFTQDGVLIDVWSTDGAPRALYLDRAKNILYVGTWDKIFAYDPKGNFLFSWGRFGSEPGEFNGVYDIELEPNGNALYVSETDNARVQRFIYPKAFRGKPAYNPGGDLGYFAWRDADDGEWHVRFSSDGVLRSYSLTVTSTNGFNYVSGVNLQSNDTLSYSGNTMTLNGKVSNFQDGVNFIAPENSKLSFSLEIDSQINQVPVTVGKSKIQANISKFNFPS